MIVIAEDLPKAEEVAGHLARSLDHDVKLFTEVSQMVNIRQDDTLYQLAKTKLKQYRKEEQVILVTTKEAARGVDF